MLLHTAFDTNNRRYGSLPEGVKISLCFCVVILSGELTSGHDPRLQIHECVQQDSETTGHVFIYSSHWLTHPLCPGKHSLTQVPSLCKRLLQEQVDQAYKCVFFLAIPQGLTHTHSHWDSRGLQGTFPTHTSLPNEVSQCPAQTITGDTHVHVYEHTHSVKGLIDADECLRKDKEREEGSEVKREMLRSYWWQGKELWKRKRGDERLGVIREIERER